MTERTWHAEERFRGDGWRITSSEPIDCGKFFTRTVAVLDYPGPEAEKIAHKIAAAEDMEAALLSLANSASGLRIAEDEIRLAVGNTNWEVLRHHIENARQALAKARGGS